jgi:hypothetical protein
LSLANALASNTRVWVPSIGFLRVPTAGLFKLPFGFRIYTTKIANNLDPRVEENSKAPGRTQLQNHPIANEHICFNDKEVTRRTWNLKTEKLKAREKMPTWTRRVHQPRHELKYSIYGLRACAHLPTSEFFSIAARVPEGADGSGGPRAAPIAAPVSQRSRKPPARGRRLIQPPDLLPETLGGRQSGARTAAFNAERCLIPAACTAGRALGGRYVC